MIINYPTKSLIVHLAVIDAMDAVTCDYLNLMVKQATTAPIWNRIHWSELAAPDEGITTSTFTNQEVLLSRPVKTAISLSLRQPDPQVGNLKNKAAPPQEYELMVDLSLVGDKALKKDSTEKLSKHKGFWSRRLGTI